ncbi:antitoxin VbhA family protein [Gallibacterium trehalosifermentans]|uniref:Antitoxin VbhA family protein n=1 Tax=Gallibacterium trehalosifermentans TaxID=516935 RepID=A0ABV6H186_9PAST
MITEQEKIKRRNEVEYAKASVGLEGIYLSDQLLAISEEYIQGKLTSQEYTNKLLKTINSN